MSTNPHAPAGWIPRDGRQALPSKSHVIAVPAGTPYHRLALSEQHRWWRPLVATLTAMAGWWLSLLPLVIVLSVAGAMAGVEQSTDSDLLFADPLWDYAALLLTLALMLPAVLLAARWMQCRAAGTLCSVAGRLRWRWLLVCLAVAAAAVLFLCGLLALFAVTSGAAASESTPPTWAGWPTFLTAGAVIVLLVPLQAAAEEYVFRGWFLQVFGCYLRTPWVGIAVGAVLFALAHGLGTPWGFADLVVFGVVLGVLVLRTGGLEAAIAFHVVNNLFFSLFQAAFVDGLSDTSTRADASWVLPAADAIVMLLYAWVILRLSRRLRIARTAPEPPRPLAEAAATAG